MAIKHKSQKQIIKELRAENAGLRAELTRVQADMAYLSMMTDVDLITEEEEGNQHEQEI